MNESKYDRLLQSLKKWMSEYKTVYSDVIAKNDWKNPFRDTISREIPELLKECSGIKDPYTVVGSYGKGRWTQVPWISIFDTRITSSAQHGVYIVYLLNKDTQELYLTFEIAATEVLQPESKDGKSNPFVGIVGKINSQVSNTLQSRADEIRNAVKDDYFLSDNLIKSGSDGYDAGAIYYKKYSLHSLPAGETIASDLTRMIDIYKRYYAAIVEAPKPGLPSVGSFDSWEIISGTVALKHCDKSFFADNGSGVPKEICWFFDADDMKMGTAKEIELYYNNQNSYSGSLKKDSVGSGRVRIFWHNDLGKRFDTYKDRPDAVAKFTKVDTDTYEISFEEGEKEMTVKDQLAQIKEYIAMKGFSYEGNLIDNFWLSLKSKPFVLLAGTSGTGKTRLVRLFAEAIGATNENGRYKLVSVRPDWSDSSDLFGHVDLNGHFVPGAIIDFVKKAELDPEYPYFLCLDEMNLARVEYYLSDFLSVIETRERKGGTIVTDPLVNPSCYGRDAVAAGKYGKVILPENLYVIGTVNMDETTFPFSRKVLDRANTIEFSYVDLSALPNESSECVESLMLGNDFLKTNYLTLKECMTEQADFQGFCNCLEDINRILQEAGAHVGYRVRDEIVFYFMNNKKNDLIPKEEAFDNEIMQKILPRIQGSSNSVRRMLCRLFYYCVDGSDSGNANEDYEQMKQYADNKSFGKYKNSANKILNTMIRRFDEDGFTSYWL